MKLHQLFFYLLILLLPTQLGKHFWPDWAMVQGIRVDYLSPTLYLTDILVVLILFFWWWDKKFEKLRVKNDKSKKATAWSVLSIGGFLILILILNCLLAASPPVAFYKLIKILEFSLLGLYIAKTRPALHVTCYMLSLASVYSSLIAIFQFLNQASLGGITWFLGERTFNAGTPGIAQVVLDGRLVLRPYATFSHPNVLGGFLAVTLPLLILLKPRFRQFSFILGTIALFLTFSHSAWFVFGLSLMAYGLWFFRKNWKQLLRYWYLLLVLVFIGSIFFSPTISRFQALTEIQPESIKYRQDLNSAALKMIGQSPVFGVGLGNFLVRLPEFWEEKGPVRWFQPAHNIYLLITAETGLVGLVIFLWFLLLTYRRLLHCPIVSLSIALSAILALGLFDHYFYTLQQGQLLVTIVLGLAWSPMLK